MLTLRSEIILTKGDNMNKIIFSLTVLLSSVAMADHHLQSAMESNQKLSESVYSLMFARGMVCNLTDTVQMVSEIGKTDKAPSNPKNVWRQIAFCYENDALMDTDKELLKKGDVRLGSLTPNAILDVTYESEGKVLDISIK